MSLLSKVWDGEIPIISSREFVWQQTCLIVGLLLPTHFAFAFKKFKHCAKRQLRYEKFIQRSILHVKEFIDIYAVEYSLCHGRPRHQTVSTQNFSIVDMSVVEKFHHKHMRRKEIAYSLKDVRITKQVFMTLIVNGQCHRK